MKKPFTKPERKHLQKNKWSHAMDVVEYFESMGINVIMFECPDTPHLRIKHIDYWPATTRFKNMNTNMSGYGFSNLKHQILDESHPDFFNPS